MGAGCGYWPDMTSALLILLALSLVCNVVQWLTSEFRPGQVAELRDANRRMEIENADVNRRLKSCREAYVQALTERQRSPRPGDFDRLHLIKGNK